MAEASRKNEIGKFFARLRLQSVLHMVDRKSRQE